MKKWYFWVTFKKWDNFSIKSLWLYKNRKRGRLQKGNMHFNTIFLTCYLLVVELKTKLVTFSAFKPFFFSTLCWLGKLTWYMILDTWMVSFSLLFALKEFKDNWCQFLNQIYRLQEIACLPCTHITDISLEIWKCRYIIQLSIYFYLTCNYTVLRQVFETELFYLISPVK